MKSTLLNRLRGYVRLELRGRNMEKLLNALTTERFGVWDIRRTDQDAVELCVLVRDFFKLRSLAKRTGSRARMRIRERYGLPFALDKLGRRKMFIAGIVGFFAAIYVLSMLVWRVDIEGNDKIARSDIVQAAREYGIYRFQWKFRLPDPDRLSRELQLKLPGTSWVGVDVQGTRVHIKIVESARPDERPLMSPRHLVAAKDALVTQILAEKGKPLVRPNTNVSKGDILISGYIGDDANRQTVVAQGTVRGIVWEEATVEIPLVLKRKVYTGESKKRSYLVIGNRGLQLSGYGDPAFPQFETIPERKTLQWRGWSLPVGWLKETLLESRLEEIPLDPETAKTIALDQARAEVVAAAGADAVWRGEKIILHEKSDNGKVYMKVLFEIEQPIAVELPIVP
ncbi:sporulation protein YqfD [Paenibacillus flagellatus]|uniref:Sporulation protein YqfD n=1 Tax=Paenibacillus flagellatus TaxID=2211139 RepID=A0A2V5JY23_9BACL|nr:sporulation protein YqfD [Paenibacillus flagellatus]PYI51759.1 sporulation protein YqfD [Paenibacillus flagellatus]